MQNATYYALLKNLYCKLRADFFHNSWFLVYIKLLRSVEEEEKGQNGKAWAAWLAQIYKIGKVTLKENVDLGVLSCYLIYMKTLPM